MAKCKPSRIARKLAVLTQHHTAEYDFSVEEVVRLGRYAWRKGLLGGADDRDDEVVARALCDAGMDGLRGRSIRTLSGGELQRAFLAQVLAQDARVLLLDEATNHLDLVYQRQVFDLISGWVRQPGRAAVCACHDLTLARAYGTHALLLSHGACIAAGRIEEVFDPGHLEEAFGMDVYGWMREKNSVWET
jgi:iron complex transport system ATP-binding protein